MATGSSQDETRPLNPEMVYRPDTPASTSYNAPRGTKSTKVHRIIVVALRVLLFFLSLAGIIVGCLTYGHLGQVVLVVLFFLCLFWNLAQILAVLFGNAKSRLEISLPKFRLDIGKIVCLCNAEIPDDEEDDDQDLERAVLIGRDDDHKDSRGPPRTWGIDFSFGLVALIMFICILVTQGDYYRHYDHADASVLAFSFVIFFFEFVVTIMSCIKIYRKTGSGSGRNEYEYRIRLPTEPEHRKDTGKNISISA